MSLLAELQYKFQPNAESHENICCKCLDRKAMYSTNTEQKADDCLDTAHSYYCWLCERCMKTLGLLW